MSLGVVVFDIDDTLYLERDYVRSGFDAASQLVEQRCGIDGFGAIAWSLFEAGVRRNTFDLALDRLKIADAELVAALVERYRTHRPTIAPASDVEPCVEGLRRSVHLAVLSDGPLVSQRAKTEALGLRSWAERVVLTEELGQGFGKPHRAGFTSLQTAFGEAGDRLAYVADNPAKDFGAPRGLGWRTIRIRRPGSLHEAVPTNASADRELRDLGGLLAALELV